MFTLREKSCILLRTTTCEYKYGYVRIFFSFEELINCGWDNNPNKDLILNWDGKSPLEFKSIDNINSWKLEYIEG